MNNILTRDISIYERAAFDSAQNDVWWIVGFLALGLIVIAGVLKEGYLAMIRSKIDEEVASRMRVLETLAKSAPNLLQPAVAAPVAAPNLPPLPQAAVAAPAAQTLSEWAPPEDQDFLDTLSERAPPEDEDFLEMISDRAFPEDPDPR